MDGTRVGPTRRRWFGEVDDSSFLALVQRALPRSRSKAQLARAKLGGAGSQNATAQDCQTKIIYPSRSFEAHDV